MTDAVTLATGEVVDSSDPAWLAECQARHQHVQTLLGMRFLSDRRLYLNNLQQTEGAVARQRVQDALTKAWEDRAKAGSA